MESNFMKDLYYGRIQPSERQFPNSKETIKAAKDVQSAKGNLIHHLTPMQKSLLDTYIEKESILEAHNNYEAFLEGFHLASQMMLSAITGKE